MSEDLRQTLIVLGLGFGPIILVGCILLVSRLLRRKRNAKEQHEWVPAAVCLECPHVVVSPEPVRFCSRCGRDMKRMEKRLRWIGGDEAWRQNVREIGAPDPLHPYRPGDGEVIG